MKAERKADIDLGLVVFGKDEANKPHASVFTTGNADLALKAAQLMGMKVLRPASEAAKELAAKLPKGRIFASGRGFVPFVRPKLFEALLAAHADPANQVAGGDPTPGVSGPRAASSEEGNAPANSISEVGEGAVVLAPAAPGEGWWEAVVVKVKGDLLTLRWRDYPDEVPFARRRNQIALFDFAAVPGAR